MNNDLMCDCGTIQELRPYEKCLAYGAGTLTDMELLAAIIRTGTNGKSSIALAGDVLSLSINSRLSGLINISIEELMEIKGIGRAKAVQIKCICELSRRIAKQSAHIRMNFSSPESIAMYYMEDMRHLDRERLILAMLDSKLQLIKDVTMSVGTATNSLVSSREIFTEACRYRAVFIVLVHNHPSGSPSPSQADIEVTQKIFKAGELLGIRLIDHIVIGDNTYTSLKELNLLPVLS